MIYDGLYNGLYHGLYTVCSRGICFYSGVRACDHSALQAVCRCAVLQRGRGHQRQGCLAILLLLQSLLLLLWLLLLLLLLLLSLPLLPVLLRLLLMLMVLLLLLLMRLWLWLVVLLRLLLECVHCARGGSQGCCYRRRGCAGAFSACFFEAFLGSGFLEIKYRFEEGPD